jgi:non-ribosomal peptide synthase protein (TIGR01720 family)
MLRARFQQEATAACGWRQYISTDTARSYRFRSWNDVSVEQIKPVLEQARQGLDIENGPVMAVDLVTANNNEQYLMMVAHHLVVDLVSWNVILGDLEDYLQTQKFTSEKPYPFSAWATQQQQYAVDNFPPEKALPLPIRPPNYSYWDMTHRINIVRDTVHHTISLSERDTATLLTTCNKSFGAEPMDMLSSALSHSFSYVFRDRKPPTIFRYSHGREAIGSAADVSGTVGWFTTLSPIHVPVRGRDDSISVLRRAIASRKKLPMNGLAYFASRYYHPAGMKTFPVLDQMEVTINYLGNADNQRRSASEIFDMSGAIQNGLGAEGQEVKAFALFSISAEVVKGKLEIQCVWNGKMARQEEIRKWFFEFGNALKDVAYQARKGTKLGIGAY